MTKDPSVGGRSHTRPMGDTAELYILTPEALVQRLTDSTIAVRDQAEHADAETLAEICRVATKRMPDHLFWGGLGLCPEFPFTNLWRRTMNGDGFLAVRAREIRSAMRPASEWTWFDHLGAQGLVPLPRELPDRDDSSLLLYSGNRALILSAIGTRDDAALANRTEWLVRELQRGEIERRRR